MHNKKSEFELPGCTTTTVCRLGGHDGDSLLTGSVKYKLTKSTKQDLYCKN